MNLPNGIRKKRSFLEIKENKNWITWNPYHSKLSAYILAKGMYWPFTKKSIVLYLGAAEGTTIRFLSNICYEGRIIGVDISPTSMAELLLLVEEKENIIPFLGDAQFPKHYRPHANSPDVIYQDIAQGNQLDIFIRNYNYFKPKCGFLMLKSKSIRGNDNEIIALYQKKMETHFKTVECINISKWAKGHRAYYVQ
ncbi:fibrillarin-like rRNA/tRNA 2'-O-methyltransferase [Euryarchaeota archaeon]|nr:fibrillarin-like rRNA/tRNA 2'-O-methyltransferase [Euryarchaeota archaeon]